MQMPDVWDVVIRLLAATLVAGIVGLDREFRQKPAGLRTHMLVGLGSAAFMLFALRLSLGLADANGLDGIRTDPIRIAEGIIGGIGFLGAGTIIQSRGNVQGLTTAAGVWTAGAIGVACGAGQFFLAICVMVVALICLLPVQLVESMVQRQARRAGVRSNEASKETKTIDSSSVRR